MVRLERNSFSFRAATPTSFSLAEVRPHSPLNAGRCPVCGMPVPAQLSFGSAVPCLIGQVWNCPFGETARLAVRHHRQASGELSGLRGRRTVTVVPSPGSLSKATAPWCRWTIVATIWSPRPMPGTSRACSSERMNGSNSLPAPHGGCRRLRLRPSTR